MCLIINRLKTANEVQPVIPKHDIFKARREREMINNDLIDAIKTKKNKQENEGNTMDKEEINLNCRKWSHAVNFLP